MVITVVITGVLLVVGKCRQRASRCASPTCGWPVRFADEVRGIAPW